MSNASNISANEGNRNFGHHAHANELVNFLISIDESASHLGPMHFPSHRQSTDKKADPDWVYVLELLAELNISLDTARRIHNAINPDRAYSQVRFRIKFCKEMARRAS